jgi:hypothetical protein
VRKLDVDLEADDDFPIRRYVAHRAACWWAKPWAASKRRPAARSLASERCSDEVEADREMAGFAARDRDRRKAGEVGGNREDVLEIELQRIRGLLADLEGGRRDGRGEQYVDAGEGGEVFGARSWRGRGEHGRNTRRRNRR